MLGLALLMVHAGLVSMVILAFFGDRDLKNLLWVAPVILFALAMLRRGGRLVGKVDHYLCLDGRALAGKFSWYPPILFWKKRSLTVATTFMVALVVLLLVPENDNRFLVDVDDGVVERSKGSDEPVSPDELNTTRDVNERSLEPSVRFQPLQSLTGSTKPDPSAPIRMVDRLSWRQQNWVTSDSWYLHF